MMVTYQTAASRKMKYEMARNRLRNSANYHGHGVDVSPLWYAPMSSFGSNPQEAQRFMSERSRFAGTDIYERQAMAQRADAAALRQQRIMQEQLRSMRRPEQLANDALMMRYATMYGGQKGANPNWVAQGNAVKAQRAAAFETRRAEQLANKELLRRFYMQGGKGALGMGMKGAFQRGISMGTVGLSAASMFGGIKAGFFSLMTGLSKAVGLLVSPVGLAVTGIAALGFTIYKIVNQIKERKADLDFWQQHQNWANEANKKANDIQLEGSIAAGGFKPVEVGYEKQIDKTTPPVYSLGDNAIVKALISEGSNNKTAQMVGSEIIKMSTKNSTDFLPKEEIDAYYKNNSDYTELSTYYGLGANSGRAKINKDAQENARKLGVIAQWSVVAREQDDVKKAVADIQKAMQTGNTKRAQEILSAYKPWSNTSMNTVGPAKEISELKNPTGFYEWQYAQYQLLKNTYDNYHGPSQYYKQALDLIKQYEGLKTKAERKNFDGLNFAKTVIKSLPIEFNGTSAAITLDKMGHIDWTALANSVNNGIPLNLQQQQEIIQKAYQEIYDDANINKKGIIELLATYLPQIAQKANGDWGNIPNFGFGNLWDNRTLTEKLSGVPEPAPASWDNSLMAQKWRRDNPLMSRHASLPIFDIGNRYGRVSIGDNKIGSGFGKYNWSALGNQATYNVPFLPNNPFMGLTHKKDPTSTKNNSINGSTIGTNRVPSSSKKKSGSGSQKDYANTYSRNTPRPTQVIINIDKLANFDRTMIAKDADERAMIQAIENKMAEVIMQFNSILSNEVNSAVQQAGS